MNHIVCSVVVPMYNEEEVIGETYRRLKEVMDETGEAYELIFVNDGSRDRSAEIITELALKDKKHPAYRLVQKFRPSDSRYGRAGLCPGTSCGNHRC